MFRLSEIGGKVDTTKLRIAVNRASRNYVIQANDYLDVRVYTNRGEKILDPNGELPFGQSGGATQNRSNIGNSSSGGNRSNVGNRGGSNNGNGNNNNESAFLVQADGTVILPLLDRVKLSGYTLLQADSVLRRNYSAYYKEPFVVTRVTNNRVFVLGSPGGQVITLQNDNMNLLEILAIAGGIDGGGGDLYRYGGRADNIRIIRGDLKNPQVQEIDLTTIEGMRRGNLQVEPNDIIYVDPIRRPLYDAIVDAAPLIQILSLSFIVLRIFGIQ